MVYYASTIFQALGFQSGEKATLASLGIGIAKVSSKRIEYRACFSAQVAF